MISSSNRFGFAFVLIGAILVCMELLEATSSSGFHESEVKVEIKQNLRLASRFDMPKDANYPCIPDVSKGEILYDWSENHIHEYKHFGAPWLIRIQRVKDNAAIAFVQFRDLFSDAEIPIPHNVRLRDDCSEKDVPPYPQCPNYFRITPFSNFTLLIHVSKVALRVSKKAPPYFSIITPGPDTTFKFIKKSKARQKTHTELASTSKTEEEEEEENARRLALLAAEPHWDTLEETFPSKPPPPTIKLHPDKKQESIFSV